jgi:hypothetical protein
MTGTARFKSGGRVPVWRIVLDWGSVPEWFSLLFVIAVWLGGRYSAARLRKKEKRPEATENYGIPPVLPERLRRIVFATNGLFAFGTLLGILSVVLILEVVISSFLGWFSTSFPVFSFSLVAALMVCLGTLLVHMGWYIRKLDPEIGEAIRNQAAWMGVRPDMAERYATMLGAPPMAPTKESERDKPKPP